MHIYVIHVNTFLPSGIINELLYAKSIFLFSASDNDIIDEAIYYFKANIFFRNYEIKVSKLSIPIICLWLLKIFQVVWYNVEKIG